MGWPTNLPHGQSKSQHSGHCIASLAHSIKGGCLSLGAEPCAQAAKELEKAARRNAEDDIKTGVLRLTAELEILNRIVEG